MSGEALRSLSSEGLNALAACWPGWGSSRLDFVSTNYVLGPVLISWRMEEDRHGPRLCWSTIHAGRQTRDISLHKYLITCTGSRVQCEAVIAGATGRAVVTSF